MNQNFSSDAGEIKTNLFKCTVELTNPPDLLIKGSLEENFV